jgi:hypothetical protein
VLCALLVGVAGCSPRHHIQIESNTCWTGDVDADQYIEGCGNTSYKVIGAVRCVSVTRKGAPTVGTLRVRIDDGPWSDTVNQYGNVEACR